jgi:signal transduction histidine kinase
VGVGQTVSAAIAARAHTDAEAAALRAAFLDVLSQVILSSLDAREIASRAVTLAVAKLADVSLVWVQGHNGTLECLASKHVDPTKQDIVVEAARAVTAEPERDTLPSLVVRQKQSLLMPEISPAVLDRHRVGGAQRDMFEKLGLCTAMAVPLAVAGNTFGAMVFFAAGRHYEAQDLTLAEDVASRVSAALENARLYEVARDAIRARDDFIVLASHELRTPLAALQLTTDVLLRDSKRGTDAADASRCDTLARQVRRFNALVEHMLEALDMRAEGVKLVTGPCDLVKVVEDCVRRVGERARWAGSTIVCPTTPSIVGRWDRARVEQAVNEVLDNAVKFGEGKPIEVALRVDGTEAVLTVSDHGIGIQEERLSSIFRPFERAVSREHFGGLGLGLFIAKAIVDTHGGAIAVTSRPGEGSTFSVRLPLVSRA